MKIYQNNLRLLLYYCNNVVYCNNSCKLWSKFLRDFMKTSRTLMCISQSFCFIKNILQRYKKIARLTYIYNVILILRIYNLNYSYKGSRRNHGLWATATPCKSLWWTNGRKYKVWWVSMTTYISFRCVSVGTRCR